MIRTKRRMGLCIIWLILNLAFIWGNSLLDRENSASVSEWVGNALAAVIPGTSNGVLESGDLLRKLAHFAEFALLGVCLRWLYGMMMQKPAHYLLLPVFSGVAVAFVDEGIQMFVPGRGPGLMDVGIDSSGLVLGIVILSFISWKKVKNLEETKQ